MSIGIALYGRNGHQIRRQVEANADTHLVGVAAYPEDALLPEDRTNPDLRRYASLDELLTDDRVQLVSFCSPRRADQAAHCLQALAAGKHVYAEKPCALSETDLDALIAASGKHGGLFHEMAGSAFMQPYMAMADVVRTGKLGTIVQVYVQKAYPWYDARPRDEAIDGGLTLQAGSHAFRFVEHVVGLKITHVQAWETTLANHGPDSQCRRASACLIRLENGAVGSVTINYLNHRGIGTWGNETLRIFGTDGMLEAVDGGQRTRLVMGETDCGPIDASAPPIDYFDMFVDEILGRKPMPFSLADELHPMRMLIRARESAG